MRTLLLTFLMTFSLTVFSQNNPNTGFPIYINFDSEYEFDTSFTTFAKVEIDTTNDNNIWQIGKPQKNILNTALTPESVMITDTINPYPINDTSSFIIKSNVTGGYLAGWYYCHTDSLNDYGLIEISIDSGQTWINMLEDSLVIANIGINTTETPILTGNSNGWQSFDLGIYFNNLSPQHHGNYWIKFSFISDSIDTGHEGLMFDELLVGILANTKQVYQINNLKVFPNPANNVLNFQFDEPIQNAKIRIYSSIGQLMVNQNVTDSNMQFNVFDWHNGVYFYVITVEGEVVKNGQVLVHE